MSFQLNWAEFCALKNDAAGAVAAYETVLKADPRNVVALNNLAWTLAADAKTATRALDLIARAVREIGLTGELLDTRARVRITRKEFDKAEKDLSEAQAQDRTALRLFHVALLMTERTPANPKEAAKAFAEARTKGLDAKLIHPADLPTFRVLDKDSPAN